jgi:hypothetical protein
MNIEIGKVGLIDEGDMKGWYIRVDDDTINTGGFLILYNSCPNMSSSSGYDDWVENRESLKYFFAESSWNIKWLE